MPLQMFETVSDSFKNENYFSADDGRRSCNDNGIPEIMYDDGVAASETSQENCKKCFKCNKNYAAPSSLRMHMIKAHCMTKFDAREYAEFQCVEKEPRKPNSDHSVSCLECNKTYVRPSTLRMHYLTVHDMNLPEVDKLMPAAKRRKIKKYVNASDCSASRIITATECYSCKERFDRLPSLLEHFYQMHRTECDISARRTNENDAVRFQCYICNKFYIRRHTFRVHLVRVHGLAEDLAWIHSNQSDTTATEAVVQSSATETLSFVCEICNSAHSTRFTLRQHMIRGHELSSSDAWNRSKATNPVLRPIAAYDRQWICFVCKKPYAQKKTLRIHLEKSHPIGHEASAMESLSARNECHICHKTYKHHFSLEDHLQRKHKSTSAKTQKSDRVFPCNHCNVAFNRAWQLREHIKILKNGKPIFCKKCYTGFDGRAELIQHMETSENCKRRPAVKTQLCTYCGKTFGQKCALDVHIRQHLNVRPFACDQCDETFFTRLAMQRHQPVHVIIPQHFPCQVEGCNKTYSQLSFLKYHEKQKHSEPTLKCPQCDQMFTTERYRRYDEDPPLDRQ